MNDQKTLLIRVDADERIGSGHVMRCLALAEAWQDCGGNVTAVLATSSPLIEKRLFSESIEIQHLKSEPGSSFDAYDTIKIAQAKGAKWIVVDGYHFGGGYQKIIKGSGLSLLFIDDYGHADHYYADIVLNQNLYADLSFYQKYESYTRFLLGTDYILLRREFLKWAGYKRYIPRIGRKVLVTFGGSDPDNVTLFIIELLKQIQIKGLKVIVVVGGINKNYEILQQSIKDRVGFSIRKNITNMAKLMAWADVGIAAGGTTCWELAFMGLPSILYPIAENQKFNVQELNLNGYVECFGSNDVLTVESSAKIINNLLFSYQNRMSLHKKIKELIDGNGNYRVIEQIHTPRILLRYAKKSDCDLIYSWINDPFVRSNSFNSEKISFEEHEDWFSSIISDPSVIYYIALDIQKTPIGQARFKIHNNEADISVLLGIDNRGKNLGSELINCTTIRCFNETGIIKINAYIKLENTLSYKAFIKAGYSKIGIILKENQYAYHLIKARNIE